MEGLSTIDGWATAAILGKAAGYAAALLAMGGPLFLAVFRQSAPVDVLRIARRVAVCAALAGLAILVLRFGIRAARLSGMGLDGATDVMMLGLVWDSPLGTAALWRGAGEVLILGLLIEGTIGVGLGLVGTLLVAISYTFVGHSLGDPRWLLAGLLILHLLAAAFWVGALAPLHRATRAEGAALLHRFGQVAAGTVTLLIVVGTVFAWLMTGSLTGLLTTAYGWTLLAKLALVAGLMALAAVNKWRLVPGLAAGTPDAPVALRRSIKTEIAAVGLILLVTATLTSVTTPPVNL